ncbi:DUF4435 domain-containing protein [Shewanella woodyi]|uniref:DUF4435 domain-containing protein n=1 Tax=Shewanella woodyi (strain ATCC 51908 / MS32) TaxID=392500 RepID=B1KEZ8_SHEWM|nr:DUF4435 domain-containing protein [Shewanella woodyi]ACA85149.1 conserved hypothetical protein [Shewanella woodyi ATCC 51908]
MTSCLSQSAEEIVTEISMSESKNPWLVVEGDSDGVFFSTKRLHKSPNTIVALGWENVVGVISQVIEESITKAVFGFIDRDYREELGVVVDESYIVTTDFRDLEISLFESSSLHRLIVEYGSKFKLPLDSNEEVDLDEIKVKIYSIASKMGRLRYFSLKEGYNYPIKKLDFSKFIDQKTLELDESKLINQINAKSENKINSDLLNTILSAKLPTTLCDAKNICSGHDVVELLGLALKKVWGTNNSGEVAREKLESSFRIGYSNEEFSQTTMYKKLNALLS